MQNVCFECVITTYPAALDTYLPFKVCMKTRLEKTQQTHLDVPGGFHPGQQSSWGTSLQVIMFLCLNFGT